MKSYRCLQCGLVNWTTEELCKRCQSPNPFLNQVGEPNGFAPNFGQTSAPAQMMPDYSAPPPPNVFGVSVGTMAAAPVGFSAFPPPVTPNRPPIRSAFQPNYAPEDLENLQKAEKQIRNAWICGVIICVMSTIVAAVLAKVAASTDMIQASPGEIMISVVIFGGLTLGVYFKSRACAVLLCGLFILDKIITMASTGKFSGAILTFVFIYYFIYGIQGTFTYRRLKR